MGIEQFTGNATVVSGIASLGNPANTFNGPNYYFTTAKGTSHEPGWVSPDCYGNLGYTMAEIYTQTKFHLAGLQ